MYKWKPGDWARIKAAPDDCHPMCAHLRGTEVQLVERSTLQGYWTISAKALDGHPIAAREDMLEPIQPLGSWSELAVALGVDIRTRKPLEVKA